MEQTANEFVKLFRERLKYPIIIVYIIALIVYNWDVISILFYSNQPIEYRVAYLTSLYKDPYYFRLITPLFRAIIVMVIAPLVMWGLEYPLKLINSNRFEFKINRENSLIDIKEKREEKAKNHELKLAEIEYKISQEKNGNQSLIQKQQEIDRINAAHEEQISSINEVVNSLNETISSKDKTIVNLQDLQQSLQSKEEGQEEELASLRGVGNKYFELSSDFIFIEEKLKSIFNNTFLSLVKNQIVRDNIVDIVTFPQGKQLSEIFIRKEFYNKYNITQANVNEVITILVDNKFWANNGSICYVTDLGQLFVKLIAKMK